MNEMEIMKKFEEARMTKINNTLVAVKSDSGRNTISWSIKSKTRFWCRTFTDVFAKNSGFVVTVVISGSIGPEVKRLLDQEKAERRNNSLHNDYVYHKTFDRLTQAKGYIERLMARCRHIPTKEQRWAILKGIMEEFTNK